MPPPRVSPATPVWDTSPPVTASPCSCVARSRPPQSAPDPTVAVRAAGSIAIEYGEDDVGAFSALARSRTGAVTLASATGGDAESSPRYRDVLRPSGLPHELRLTLRAAGGCWGALVLLRAADAPPFSPAEVAVVAGLGVLLGEGLRRSLVLGAVTAAEERGPAVMVLRLDGGARVESAVPPVSDWRAEIDDGDDGSRHGVPFAVIGLARTALSRLGGVARSRARGRDGGWMTMHATTLDAAAPSGDRAGAEPPPRDPGAHDGRARRERA